jgi:3-dehydroquinate dehydratase/shikimate dehydrogenase
LGERIWSYSAGEEWAVALQDVDSICVVIGRTRHAMVQAEVQEAAREGARLIEIRLDLLKRPPDFKRLLDQKPCPLVATVRRPEDGGRWTGPEDARRMLIRQAIVAGFDWVDLEIDIADKIPRFGQVRRIVSYHNIREVPANLQEIHARLCDQDADVVKIAVRGHHPLDNLRILKLLESPQKPTIAFCMGEVGFPSRILGAKFGAPFTYAAFNKERTLAPGMPTFLELKKLYHYHLINSETRVFGVLGDPVAHSLSPHIHNLSMRRSGLNAIYLPFRVSAEAFPAFLEAFESIPVQGYSVTIPHKEAAARLALKKDITVERTQAANTLIREGDGFTAYNTDYRGALETLLVNLPRLRPGEYGEIQPDPASASLPASTTEERAPENLGAFGAPLEGIRAPETRVQATVPRPLTEIQARDLELDPAAHSVLQGKVVLLLGAGGVARAIAHALHREGALLTIANRTVEKAERLASEVGCRYIEWAGRHSVTCQIAINCTPVGMHPQVDESPLHASFFRPGLVIFDTVYTPENTLMVKEARSRGAAVITGVELFVRQAALQFRLFTGKQAPIDLMRKVVKRLMSPVTLRGQDELV